MYPELQQIYWYSGVYLQPQHLQSVDLHHNYMLSRQRQLAQPWNVGMIQCDFNPETLVDFTLKIERLQAILPSGDYLEYPGNCALPPRQFRDAWKQIEKPFTLWLALRRFDPGHANVGDSPNSRWLKPHEEGVMKDVYFNGPECSVSRILYNVQILSDEEKAAVVDCEFLPLIRLRYENDRVVSDSHFCPPLVTLNGYPALKTLLDGLYAELANRAHQLAEYKRPDQLRDASRGDVTQLLAMRSLNRTLPLLQHYCRTPTMHPWPIYGLLAQLIGELSSFSERCSFNGEWEGEDPLLPYDHFNLCASFASARKLIIALLNNLTLENNTWVTLNPDEQSVFRGDLQSMPWNNAGSVLLMLRSEKLVAEVIDSSSFKIAPDATVTTLIQHALPGITATWLNPTPRGVPHRQDAFYFRLNQQNSLWKQVEQQKNLAFYWDDAPADLQVQAIFMGRE
ncbi:type VI secretion protein [Enterobacter roggenkampii]|uniref:type VI secretion system baseplate subunit TssK n=1 Tax=Enterobacter TaxID=547 RepID=UPI0005F90365|nr:type VI secretion system baseplate subunit TssK [Enterobacter mori]KJX01430.1 type VI secretion protein [Enterobacter roggenkampii]MCG5129787.1 type VI secretion system baseplate subunit TssK [Enterobacter mori]